MRERCTRIVHKALAVVRPQFRLGFSDGIHGLPHEGEDIRVVPLPTSMWQELRRYWAFHRH